MKKRICAAFVLCGSLLCSCGVTEGSSETSAALSNSSYEAAAATSAVSEDTGTAAEKSVAETAAATSTETAAAETSVPQNKEKKPKTAETSVTQNKEKKPETAKTSVTQNEEKKPTAAAYAYSSRASRVQGDWIYYYDSAGKSLRRISRSGEKDEKVFDCADEMGMILVSQGYVYYSAYVYYDTYDEEEAYCIYRIGLDGNGKKLLLEFPEDSDYHLDKTAVYDDVLYYSYHGASMETDRAGNRLYASELGEKTAEELYAGYQTVYFFEDGNGGFCAAWRGEKINSEASEEEDYIITDLTDDYCIYRAETGKTETVRLPEELIGAQNIEALRYTDGAVWVYANFVTEQKLGCITADGRFEETELPANAAHPSVSYDGKEIYFQTRESGPDESGQYAWINTGKILWRLAEGNAEKLAELNVHPTVDLKSYELGREYILYADSEGQRVYWDMTNDRRVNVPQ